MIDSCWEESRLDELQSSEPGVKLAAEAYFASLSSEDAAEIVGLLNFEKTYVTKVGVLTILPPILLLLVIAMLRGVFHHLPRWAIPFPLVAVLLISIGIVVNNLPRLKRVRQLDEALVFLKGEVAFNKIVKSWLISARLASEDYWKQAAFANLAEQIDSTGGSLTTLDVTCREALAKQATRLDSKAEPTPSERHFRTAVREHADNLLPPALAEELRRSVQT